MKLTIEQAEAKLTAVWGRRAFVLTHRVCGNRYVHAATDHQDHWIPLQSSWIGGRQLFEPLDGPWPERVPMRWEEAVLIASQRALAHFVEQGNRAAIKRLPRALVIAEGKEWQCLGDERDTWLIPSSKGEKVYEVNGRCTCPDLTLNGVQWCKHRLARGLARRAAEILKNENGAGSGAHSTAPAAPDGPNEDLHSSTGLVNGQVRRVDVTVGYEADDAKTLPRINGNGQLIHFKVDGKPTQPPVPTTPELYRWLQVHNYVPQEFKWLDWEHGLRQRRQTYILEVTQ